MSHFQQVAPQSYNPHRKSLYPIIIDGRFINGLYLYRAFIKTMNEFPAALKII